MLPAECHCLWALCLYDYSLCVASSGGSGTIGRSQIRLPLNTALTAVASLRLVSPGAATDGVTYFFPQKLTTFSALCKVMTFLAVVSSLLPPSDVVYPVFFLNSTTFFYFSRVSTPGWCHTGHPAPPSNATEHGQVVHTTLLMSSTSII